MNNKFTTVLGFAVCLSRILCRAAIGQFHCACGAATPAALGQQRHVGIVRVRAFIGSLAYQRAHWRVQMMLKASSSQFVNNIPKLQAIHQADEAYIRPSKHDEHMPQSLSYPSPRCAACVDLAHIHQSKAVEVSRHAPGTWEL
ncbi:hypothetical protein FB567DRAFT_13363 [Paraphoma chrysanthemicola]|uniref:Secreted protein n=1 Tax=Paraphoma chrysanthemicola TaxID=798071 RepID=A0A8K0RGB4_9PLEO|nr:hypothetical protein FB567DRAFT_13363 [Paraphoma chrysanthemicola]